jgi:hypothetical protein
MKGQRKLYTSEEKIAILRRYLLEKEPISGSAMNRVYSPQSTAGKRIHARDEVSGFRNRAVRNVPECS